MKTERTKNIVIILLLFLSIYQTMQLWFEDISSHNFFSTFLTPKAEINLDIKQPFYYPYRIVTNSGNDKYIITYEDIEDNIKEQGFTDILNNIKSLEFISENEINLDEILKGRLNIYQYSISMNAELFLESLDKNNKILNKVKNFDSIIVVPSREISVPLKVLFVDNESNKYYEYHMQGRNTPNDFINDYFKKISAEENDVYYDSANKLNLPVYKKDIFLPKWKEDSFAYKSLQVTNPYVGSSGPLLDDIGNMINDFFDNPTAKTSTSFADDQNSEKGYYLYSDAGQKAVKFYLGNECLLEYTNFGDFSKYKKTSMLNDYNAAIKFIEKDKLVVNQLFLSECEEDEEQRVFYFDYVSNNFKIIVPDRLYSTLNLKKHIEITVQNGMVTKYRKCVLNYTPNETFDCIADNSYDDEINLIYNSSEENKIDDINLVYKLEIEKINDYYKNITLVWDIKIKGVSSLQPTQKKQVIIDGVG